MQTSSPAIMARKKRGLSVGDVAKAARMTPATVRRYERGDGQSLGIARKLARIYGCAPFAFTRQAQI